MWWTSLGRSAGSRARARDSIASVGNRCVTIHDIEGVGTKWATLNATDVQAGQISQWWLVVMASRVEVASDEAIVDEELRSITQEKSPSRCHNRRG